MGIISCFKTIGKGLISAVIYQVSAVLALPRMIRIYCDRKIKSYHIRKNPDFGSDGDYACLCMCEPCTDSLAEEVKENMELRIESRYRMPLNFFRHQMRTHVVSTIIFLLLGGMNLLLNAEDDGYERSTGLTTSVWCFEGLMALFGFVYGIGRKEAFIELCDQLLYSIRSVFNKNVQSRFDERAYRAASIIGDTETLHQLNRLNPLNPVHSKLVKPPFLQFHREIVNNTSFNSYIADIILSYSLPPAAMILLKNTRQNDERDLIFSTNHQNNIYNTSGNVLRNNDIFIAINDESKLISSVNLKI